MIDTPPENWEQTQRKLFEHIERLEALNDLVADYYWELDADNRVVWVSDSFRAFLDAVGSDHMNRPIADVLSEFTRQAGKQGGWDEVLQCIKNGAAHHDMHVFAESANMGRIDWSVSSIPIYDDQGQYRGLRGAATDISERVKAEQDLLSKSIIFEGMKDGVSIVSSTGVILDTNPAYEKIIGLPPGQAVGMTREELQRELEISPATSSELQDTIFKTGPFELEIDIRRKDGERRTLLASGFPLYPEVKEDQTRVSIVRDITDQKQAEAELTASEASLARAQRIANIGNWDWDLTTDEVNWSDETYSIFGFGEERIKPTPELSQRYIHPEDQTWVMPAVEASMELGGEPYSVDYRMYRTDGSLRHVHAEGETTRDENGTALKVFGTLHDITDRVEAEQQNRLQSIVLQSMKDAVVIIDGDGRVIDCNPAYEEIFGLTRDQVIGMTGKEIWDELDFQGGSLANIEDSLGTNSLWQQEFSIQRKDGGRRDIHGMGYKLYPDNPMDDTRVSILRDISARKRVESQLIENQANLNNAQRIARMGSWSWDLLTEQVTWSDETFNLFGYGDDRIPPTLSAALANFHPDDVPAVEDAIQASQVSGASGYSIDHRIVQLDGTVRFAHSEGEITFSAKGEPLKMHGTIHDITDRKLAQLKLQQSEERFRDIAAAASDILYEVNKDFFITYVSEEFKLLFSSLDINIQNQDLFSVFATFDALSDDNGWQDLSQVFRRHQTPSAHAVSINMPGTNQKMYLLINAKPVYDENGDFSGYRGAATDVSEHMAQDETIRRSEQRFRDVVAASSDLIWETDADGRYTYVSEWVEETTGVPVKDILGLTLTEFQNMQQAASGTEELQLKVLSRKPFVGQLSTLTYPDDRTFYWSTSGNPYFNGDGSYAGCRGLTSDITDQVKRDEQLRQAQRMEAVGQLTGGVAHDFNNILMSMQLNLEFLQPLVPQDSEGPEFIDTLIGGINRAAELTQRLLAFSRQQVLQPKAIDVNQQIGSLVNMMQRTLGEDIHIETAFSEQSSLVSVDPGQLESAVLNLSLNARHAMPKGGTLTLATQTVSLTENDLGDQTKAQPGNYLMVSVRDTGTGMTPDIIAQVFEPFFTTKGVGEGSGLGLSMVHGFVAQSHGHIAIESEPGHGTDVKMYFPQEG